MGLIGKFIKRGSNDNDEDDDDDLDPQDADDSEDAESDNGGLKSWLMVRFRGLRSRKGSDDDDDDKGRKGKSKKKNTGSGKGNKKSAEEPEDEEDLPDVQVVRLEGVPDVRVVGDSSGAASPQSGNAPAAGAQGAAGGGEASAAQGAADSGKASEKQDGSKEEAKEGSGLSLKDIFEEEEEIDEVLRDLAGSMENVSARELADDLKEFFDELEAIMPSKQ